MNPTRRLLLKMLPVSIVAFLYGVPQAKSAPVAAKPTLPENKVSIRSFSDPRARVSYDGIYYNDKLVKVRAVFKHKHAVNGSYSTTYRLDDRNHMLSLFRLDLTNALTLQECKVHWGLISFLWASGLNEEYRLDQPVVSVYHAVGERYRQTARLVELIKTPFV